MLRRLSLIYFVGVCLISISVQAAVLPQFELRELDIFLQDDGYSQISRTKRTDNNDSATVEQQYEDEGSGYAILDTISKFETNTTVLESESTFNISFARSSNIDEAPPEIPPEQPSTDYSYLIQPRNATETNVTSTAHLEEVPQILQTNDTTTSDNSLVNTTINPTEIPLTDPPITENLQENTTELLPLPPPLPPTVFDSAEPKLDLNTTLNSTNDNDGTAQNSTDTIDSPNLDNSTTSQNTTDSSGETLKPPANSPPVVQNGTNAVTNNTKSDTSDTVTGVTQATTAKNVKNSTDATTTKPATGESNKSSVSGSGILFTIIILAVVAGLAGLGYYIYKKRQRGYDPVEVEDRDKEMTEINPGNGFGKPILAEEVKLQDQMTPYEPKPTPRTFGVASMHEEAFGNAETIREDSDKDQKEQSVEFEEEGGKKDDKY